MDKRNENYKPFKECRGFWHWHEYNQGHKQVERFDYIVTIIVCVITTIVTRKVMGVN